MEDFQIAPAVGVFQEEPTEEIVLQEKLEILFEAWLLEVETHLPGPPDEGPGNLPVS